MPRLERLIPDANGGLAILIMVWTFLLSVANLQAGVVYEVTHQIWGQVEESFFFQI